MFWSLCASMQFAFQVATHANREPPPELGGMPREQYMPAVVVACVAQGLSELNVGISMGTIAPHWFSVSAVTLGCLTRMTSAPVAHRVDGTETGCGQGREDLGVRGHSCRHIVMSTAQASVDKLPGVARIQVRA